MQQGGKEAPEQVRPVWVRMRLHQSMQELQAAVCSYSRLQERDWVFTYDGQRCSISYACMRTPSDAVAHAPAALGRIVVSF